MPVVVLFWLVATLLLSSSGQNLALPACVKVVCAFVGWLLAGCFSSQQHCWLVVGWLFYVPATLLVGCWMVVLRPSNIVGWLLDGCFTSQKHSTVSQGRICSHKCACCHTERKDADQTFHLTQSQHTDLWPTSPSAESITPGAWQGSHFSSHTHDSTLKKDPQESNLGSTALEANAIPLGQRGGLCERRV